MQYGIGNGNASAYVFGMLIVSLVLCLSGDESLLLCAWASMSCCNGFDLPLSTRCRHYVKQGRHYKELSSVKRTFALLWIAFTPWIYIKKKRKVYSNTPNLSTDNLQDNKSPIHYFRLGFWAVKMIKWVGTCWKYDLETKKMDVFKSNILS